MSRIGRVPIEIPSGVDVTIQGQHVKVKGPKGLLEQTVPEPIKVVRDGNVLKVERPDDSKTNKSLHGLSRSLLNNLVIGVTQGYAKHLEIVGIGYKAQVQGQKLVLTIGLSHPVEYEIPKGIEVKVERSAITVSGISKQAVGECAATIRQFKKPSVYSGKGIKYKGEHVRRKVGKAAATAA